MMIHYALSNFLEETSFSIIMYYNCRHENRQVVIVDTLTVRKINLKITRIFHLPLINCMNFANITLQFTLLLMVILLISIEVIMIKTRNLVKKQENFSVDSNATV